MKKFDFVVLTSDMCIKIQLQSPSRFGSEDRASTYRLKGLGSGQGHVSLLQAQQLVPSWGACGKQATDVSLSH